MSGKAAKLIRPCRIAAMSLCLGACVAFAILWVPSYHTAERLHGVLWGDRLLMVASKQGKLVVLPFRPAFARGYWKWEIRRYPTNSPLSFPADFRPGSKLGLGLIRDPSYSLQQLLAPPRDMNWPLTIDVISTERIEQAAGVDLATQPFIVTYAPFTSMHGTGIIVPYWFLVLLSAVIGFFLWAKPGWRFSMRSMLIAVTLIAAVLGAVVAFDK